MDERQIRLEKYLFRLKFMHQKIGDILVSFRQSKNLNSVDLEYQHQLHQISTLVKRYILIFALECGVAEKISVDCSSKYKIDEKFPNKPLSMEDLNSLWDNFPLN